MKRQTALVVFPEGRDAAAAFVFTATEDFFLSVDKCVGNKYDEEKQVCMTQRFQPFATSKVVFFFVPEVKLQQNVRNCCKVMLLF